MSDAVEAVVERVRERVTPGAAERAALEAALETVLDRAEAALEELPVEAEVLHLGSTARDTWVAGDRDLDVFVRFPTSLERAELEAYGLQVGHAVLPEGYEEFAEHPYVVGEIEGFEIDLVPCYDVADASAIRSAVDRTPFHNHYLAERLDPESAGGVRVAKQFLTGIGSYGSDLRTRGFSGFLVELLVLEYGSFSALAEAAADWHPPVVLDPVAHGQAEFEDPLVVVDPTDPERNVAAVCSERNVARFQHYARDFLAEPREQLFHPADPDPLSEDGLASVLAERGTVPVAVRFEAPALVEDQLYPQLEKSLGGVTEALDRRGFDVLRAAAWADESAVLYADLAVLERPDLERHEGPPVQVREHATTFNEKYEDDDAVAGPFVDDDRYVVERPREFASARGFLESDALFGVGLGADLQRALSEGYDVLVGEAVSALLPEFATELAAFYDPKP
jgi:tRNA nucleotidyltransferase (CCA-adding enzyme)